MTATQFEKSKKSIQTGSRSFRMASLFLNPRAQRGAYLLYYWCRHCDDVIDESKNQQEAKNNLVFLIEETKKAFLPNYADLFWQSELKKDYSFLGLYELHTIYKIPQFLFLELLEGFRMDVEKDLIINSEVLSKYCYHVAGVVGLMMSYILEARDHETASHHADLLGRAMQLTNIARDIKADSEMGRIYIPLNWFELKSDSTHEFENVKSNASTNEISVILNSLLDKKEITKTYDHVLKILEWADRWYIEGRNGLCYLPFRAAWSISVASFLYQSIGLKIKRLGPQALEHRTVLNFFEKLSAIIKGSYFFLKQRLIINLKLPRSHF